MVGKRSYVIRGFIGTGAQSTGRPASRSALSGRWLARLQERTTSAAARHILAPATCGDGSGLAARLYSGRAQHSRDGFRPSVSVAAGRTVDTVRVGTTCAPAGDSRRGRQGHDRRQQAAGAGADRIAARVVVRVVRCLAAAVRPGSVRMRRRHGFGPQWHFSPAAEGGNGMGPARSGAMVHHGRRDHDEARGKGDVEIRERAAGFGPAAADSRRSFPARAGPLGVAALRVRSRERQDDGPMRRVAVERVSWVRRHARMDRRPPIGADGAVQGDDIGALSGSWTACAPARSERVAKSVSCAELGRRRAGSRGIVLLAIAVNIASKTVNAGAARAREHRPRLAPALPLAVTQCFDNRKLSCCFGNSSRTCRPPDAVHAVRRFYSR